MNNNRSVRAQQEESIRRTVYVSDIDKDVSIGHIFTSLESSL